MLELEAESKKYHSVKGSATGRWFWQKQENVDRSEVDFTLTNYERKLLYQSVGIVEGEVPEAPVKKTDDVTLQLAFELQSATLLLKDQTNTPVTTVLMFGLATQVPYYHHAPSRIAQGRIEGLGIEKYFLDLCMPRAYFYGLHLPCDSIDHPPCTVVGRLLTVLRRLGPMLLLSRS